MNYLSIGNEEEAREVVHLAVKSLSMMVRPKEPAVAGVGHSVVSQGNGELPE